MKITKIISMILLVAAVQACGGEDNFRDRQGLDPDTEAAVRQVNVERYTGDYSIEVGRTTVYMSLSEYSFYWVQKDKDQRLIGGDFGHVEHPRPGTMILWSDRVECEGHEIGRYLNLEQTAGGLVMKSKEDPDMNLNMVAVDPQERIAALPCGNLK